MSNDINIGRNQTAASATVWAPSNNDTLQTSLLVSDIQLRQMGIAHDGFEKPFVLIPTNGEWKRHDLTYAGSSSNRGSSEIYDSYNLRLDAASNGLNMPEVREKGVAFGLEVSGPNGSDAKTVWLQGPNENYRLP